MVPRIDVRTPVATLLAVGVLLLPLLAGLGAGTATPASWGEPSQDPPEFRHHHNQEHRGDVADVGIDLKDRTEAVLHVAPDGESASRYTAEVVVHDRDGDGRVDVRLDTYRLGTEVGAIAASDPDTVDVRRTTTLDERLRSGNYSLGLEQSNETVDETTLVVRPAGVDALQAWTATGGRPANLSTRHEIETAMDDGTFTRDAKLSTRDSLLLELQISGLSGPLAAQPGENATTRFLNLLATPGFSVRIHENESTVGLHPEPVAFSLTPEATTVVAAPDADTYYVLAKLGRLPRHAVEHADGDTRFETGDVFDVEVTLTDRSGIVETRQPVESQFEIVGCAAADTPIEVTPETNQTITADSSFVENRDVTVMLDDDDGPFSASRSVDVGPGGDIVATFDLSNLTPGSTLTLRMISEREDRVLFSEPAAVEVRSPTPTPTLTPTSSEVTPTPTTTDRTGETSTPDGTPTTVPGFRIAGALFAAGLLAAYVVFRRD